MKEIYDFIKRSTVFHIATVDEQGRPRVRPFAACVLVDDRLYFFTTKGKPVYDQMVSNGWVEISSYDPESRDWLRLSGRVVWDTDPRIVQAMLAAVPASVRERAGRGESTVPQDKKVFFHLEDGKAEFCGFFRKPRVVEF